MIAIRDQLRRTGRRLNHILMGLSIILVAVCAWFGWLFYRAFR